MDQKETLARIGAFVREQAQRGDVQARRVLAVFEAELFAPPELGLTYHEVNEMLGAFCSQPDYQDGAGIVYYFKADWLGRLEDEQQRDREADMAHYSALDAANTRAADAEDIEDDYLGHPGNSKSFGTRFSDAMQMCNTGDSW